MRPVRLELHNWLSYGYAVVDFGEGGLVGIAGANGLGKSSLVEAIRYALFGRGRYDNGDQVNPDPLVRDGAAAARVTLDFEVAGQLYRIVRSRSRKSRKSTLELQQPKAGGGWEPMTNGGIDYTNGRIRDLVRLDDTTFRASSLLLQGESGTFSRMSATKRKEVLVEVLGLDLYPAMKQVSSARATAAAERVKLVRTRVEELEATAARAPEVEVQIEAARAERSQRERDAAALAEEVRRADVSLAAAAEREARVRDLEAQASRAVTDSIAEACAAREEGLREAVSAAAEMRAQGDRERASLQEGMRALDQDLKRLDQREKALRDQVQRALDEGDQEVGRIRQESIDEAGRVEKEIRDRAALDADRIRAAADEADREGAALRRRLAEDRRRLEGVVARLFDLSGMREAAQQLGVREADLARLDAAETQERDGRRKVLDLRVQAEQARASHQVSLAQARARLEQLEGQTATLRGEVNCLDLARAGCTFLAGAKRAEEEIPVALALVAEVEAKRPWADFEAEIGAEEERLASLGYSPEVHRCARAAVEQSRGAAARLPALERDLEERGQLDQALAAGEAESQQKQLRAEDLRRQVCALNRELAEQIEQRLAPLREGARARMAEARQRSLARAEETRAQFPALDQERQDLKARGVALADSLAELMTRLEADIARKRAEITTAAEERARRATAAARVRSEELQAQARTLRDEIALDARRRAELEDLRGQASAAREIVAVVDRRLGTLEEDLRRVREAGQEAERLRSESSGDLREVEVYQKLTRLLDPRTGVPVEIIRTVLPELEAEANHLLDRLSGGTMELRLLLERENKDGTLADTLDIEVKHRGWTRLYEGLSGGQKFRVDFATRIALSKVLARRAGARLETLIIDEGFGSQDPTGVELLFEAIDRVRADFRLVVLITHLPELMERLPSRYHVSDGGPEGAVVRRVA